MREHILMRTILMNTTTKLERALAKRSRPFVVNQQAPSQGKVVPEALPDF
jgi:hypothetical protein